MASSLWIDTTTIGWQFTVYGQVYSMKNSKRELHVRGRFVKLTHPKVTAFRRDFLAQAPKAKEPLTGPLRTNVSVWYPSRRQDLDCALVYDLMQEAGLIENDRQIIEKHEYGHMDAANPRVEILIEKI